MENTPYSLVKLYGVDFLKHEKRYNKVVLDGEKITGTVEKLQLKGVVICIKKLTIQEEIEEEICSKCSFIKLHFIVKGCCSFFPVDKETESQVSKETCNLSLWPKGRCVQKYKGKEIDTLEILFTINYITDLIGEKHTSVLRKLYAKSLKNQPTFLLERSKRIPAQVMHSVLEIIDCSYSGATKQLYMEAKLRLLLIDFFIGKNATSFFQTKVALPETDFEVICSIEKYIRKNLKKRLTVKEFATIAGINTTKLKQNFKVIYATTVFKHITQLRMDKAKKLILEERVSIAQAADEVGYSNPQHFTVAFKKNMGYLPSSLLGECR